VTASLNHLYRVVDAQTYDAIRSSSWIGAHFAPRDERTTTRPDWTYAGVYLYGRHTYVEFFEDGPQGPAGYTGLALALRRVGDTTAVEAAWRNTLGATRTALVDRPTSDGGVPWFHLACADPDRRDGLHLWSMEYHPQFLHRWHPDLTAARGIDPADVLDRYAAAVASEPRHSFLLEDVTAVELELSADASAFLRAHLEPVTSIDVRAGGDAGFEAMLGPTCVRVRSTRAPRGLVTLGCSLQRGVTPDTRRFGASTLTLADRSAVWSFA
jgi:hypothetical protein